jgi:hypothetical protein
MASTPCVAARRVTPQGEASAAAMADHNRLWLAEVVSTLRPVSAGERGIRAMCRSIATSASLTRWATMRNHANTGADATCTKVVLPDARPPG